jgi:hypothetical protein
MDELEIADYEILQRVFRTFVAPQTERKPNESTEEYRERMKKEVETWELKRQYLQVLRKLRKAIVGDD